MHIGELLNTAVECGVFCDGDLRARELLCNFFNNFAYFLTILLKIIV